VLGAYRHQGRPLRATAPTRKEDARGAPLPAADDDQSGNKKQTKYISCYIKALFVLYENHDFAHNIIMLCK